MAETKPEVVTIQPGYQAQPVMSGGVQWMAAPQTQIGCPAGLEYLLQVDQLIVKQQIELLEAVTGWETNNKYRIQNSLGQAVYFAREEQTEKVELERTATETNKRIIAKEPITFFLWHSSVPFLSTEKFREVENRLNFNSCKHDTECCTRMCCGPARPFEMGIFDNYQREVIHLSRPLKCQCCLCWCCLQEIEIKAGGEILGYVIQKHSYWQQKLEICDAQRNPLLLIRGPCCPFSISCQDVSFQILSMDGETEIGSITKLWIGCGIECLTDADTLTVTWPLDLDVKMKAVMLGATFLLDFMFYERKN